MRLNEISDEDKNFLTLKGIQYDFIESYNIGLSISKTIGKSNNRRIRGKNTIEDFLNSIDIFLTYGFDDNDPDIIMAKDIYSKLLDIRNQL